MFPLLAFSSPHTFIRHSSRVVSSFRFPGGMGGIGRPSPGFHCSYDFWAWNLDPFLDRQGPVISGFLNAWRRHHCEATVRSDAACSAEGLGPGSGVQQERCGRDGVRSGSSCRRGPAAPFLSATLPSSGGRLRPYMPLGDLRTQLLYPSAWCLAFREERGQISMHSSRGGHSWRSH